MNLLPFSLQVIDVFHLTSRASGESYRCSLCNAWCQKLFSTLIVRFVKFNWTYALWSCRLHSCTSPSTTYLVYSCNVTWELFLLWPAPILSLLAAALRTSVSSVWAVVEGRHPLCAAHWTRRPTLSRAPDSIRTGRRANYVWSQWLSVYSLHFHF
jgi:hypothetical protein